MSTILRGFRRWGDAGADESVAQMIPLQKGDVLGKVQVDLCASEETALEVELRISSKAFNHTPDVVLETKILALHQGKHS